MFCLLPVIAGCSQKAQIKDECVSVKIDTVQSGYYRQEIRFPAKIKPSEEVNLAFKVSGTLERIFVKEGEFVSGGSLVAQIDPRDYLLQLQAAEGEYNDIKVVADRVTALYADSVTTTADYDKVRYSLQQVSAKLENAKNRFADTKLYAPFDGYVKYKLFDSPAIVGAGTPVITFFSSGMPEIEIYIPASTFRRRDEIKEFRMSFDFLQEPVTLKLINISPYANANQLYAVRLALPSTLKEKPMVGMSAMVDVVFHSGKDEYNSIPATALFKDGNDSYVWVYADGKVKRRRVVVESLHTDGSAVISQGLKEGEIIITAGVHALRENQLVKPLQAASVTNVGGLL